MAGFALKMRFKTSYQVSGITYYKFSVLVLSTDFLPNFGTDKILIVAGLLFPEPPITEYIPHTLVKDSNVSGYIVPQNLYLLGAEAYGGFGWDISDKYLLCTIDATYTIYAPDAQGVTFLPDWTPPNPVTHTFMPLEKGTFWTPNAPTGKDDFGIMMTHVEDDYTEFYPSILWLFSGKEISDLSFLAHLSVYYYQGGPDSPIFGERWWKSGFPYYSTHPDYYGGELPFGCTLHVDFDYYSTSLSLGLPSAPGFYFPPGSVSAPQVGAPWLLTPPSPKSILPGAGELIEQAGGASMSVMSFKPFMVDGEPFTVDSTIFEVQT